MINKVQKYVALMVSLLILTGCQNRKGQDDINTMHKTGEELRFYNQVSPMCETDDGIYYLDNDEFINYYDFASGQSMIVCNKPNCKHEKWNSKTPDEQRCNAYEELRIQGIFEEDSKLYVTTYYPEEGNTILVGSNLDRSNKKVVCTIEMDYCKQIALYKGMLYMATNKAIYEITEEGLPEMTGDSYTWLYGINLKSGKVDELTERQSGHNSELRMISASDGCLYLHYSYFEKPFDGTNYEKANPTNEIYRFNIAAGSYDKIETTLSGIPWLITVYESNVVLCKSSELRSKIVTFERINLESGDEEIICDEAFPISYLEVFGQFVKYDTDGESFIYDITSDKSTKLANKVVKDFIIESVTDNYLYGNKDGKSVIIAIDDYINGRANFISLDGETQ